MHKNFCRFLALIMMSIVVLACATTPAVNGQFLFTELTHIAEAGNPEAQYHLGMLYNNGIGTKRNIDKAFYWFEKAASAGDPLGHYKVGCYYAGQGQGHITPDEKMALKHKLIAAENGYALAQYDVATKYYLKKDMGKAFYWFEKAANQGVPMALYNLSVLYFEGKHVPSDKSLAYAYFKLSKLISEGSLNANAQASLDQAKTTMSFADISKAEKFISSYEAKPSVVTLRAKEGIEGAKKLVNSGG